MTRLYRKNGSYSNKRIRSQSVLAAQAKAAAKKAAAAARAAQRAAVMVSLPKKPYKASYNRSRKPRLFRR
jgi:hypothetical protein